MSKKVTAPAVAARKVRSGSDPLVMVTAYDAPGARIADEAGVDLILGGHIHLPYVRPLCERFSDLPRPIWVVQAGTAVSSRVRNGAPNSVNVIRYTPAECPRHCVVERWNHDALARCFTLVDQTTIGLMRSDGTRDSTGIDPARG